MTTWFGCLRNNRNSNRFVARLNLMLEQNLDSISQLEQNRDVENTKYFFPLSIACTFHKITQEKNAKEKLNILRAAPEKVRELIGYADCNSVFHITTKIKIIEYRLKVVLKELDQKRIKKLRNLSLKNILEKNKIRITHSDPKKYIYHCRNLAQKYINISLKFENDGPKEEILEDCKYIQKNLLYFPRVSFIDFLPVIKYYQFKNFQESMENKITEIEAKINEVSLRSKKEQSIRCTENILFDFSNDIKNNFFKKLQLNIQEKILGLQENWLFKEETLKNKKQFFPKLNKDE